MKTSRQHWVAKKTKRTCATCGKSQVLRTVITREKVWMDAA